MKNTNFNPNHPMATGYDALRNPADCLHCEGTQKAPSGDGRTACGFCHPKVPKR